MRRVLFVDDDEHILSGLKDMLRKERKTWDMVFAVGGQAALDELAKAPFDVVVSDLRMPVVDGVELLRQVREKYPRTARIILSGNSERETIVKVLPVAHQFLSKPCDAKVLRSVVERACNLEALLHDTDVRDLIGKVEKLPSVPHTYWELTQAAARPETGLTDLAEIVERDGPMSIKVLQIVNSAYFGLAQRLTSIRQAVVYLGADLLRTLALSAHVFSSMSIHPIEGFSLERVQEHSLLTARLAKRFWNDPKCAGESFTAGLLHDIGKVILATGVRERFSEVVRSVHASQRPFRIVEKEILRVTHAEVGAYLLGLWGLPLNVVEAVAFHHSPNFVTEGDVRVLLAVHVADALTDAVEHGEPGAPRDLDLAFVECAGFAAELPRWREMAEEEVYKARQAR